MPISPWLYSAILSPQILLLTKYGGLLKFGCDDHILGKMSVVDKTYTNMYRSERILPLLPCLALECELEYRAYQGRKYNQRLFY